MVPTYYTPDKFRLRNFGADVDNADLFKEYSRYRTAWVMGNEKGPLPDDTVLRLALRFPRTVHEAPEVPVEEEEELPEPIEIEPPKRKRGRPRKVGI